MVSERGGKQGLQAPGPCRFMDFTPGAMGSQGSDLSRGMSNFCWHFKRLDMLWYKSRSGVTREELTHRGCPS